MLRDKDEAGNGNISCCEFTWISKISPMALSRIGDVLSSFVDVLHGLRTTCGVLLVRHYCSDLV